MRKEFEINGYIEVQAEITEEEFFDAFIQFVELGGRSFGGCINEIQDGYYILPDGSKGSSVLEDV